MPGLQHCTLDELTDDHRQLAVLLTQGIEGLEPLLTLYRWAYLQVQIALLQPSGDPFLLATVPDGPTLAVCPMTDDATAILRAAVPDAQPWQPSGVARWADKQRWTPLIGMYLYRLPDGNYTFYDPRDPLFDDAPTPIAMRDESPEEHPCE